MSYLHRARAFVNHWLDVVDHHSIHSPYFFDFYSKVISGRVPGDKFFERVEQLRKTVLQNHTEIDAGDLGSGTSGRILSRRKISDIAETSVSPPELARLYYNICRYSESRKIVELGTSAGLTTLYLSHVDDARVFTFEGSHALANVALTHFELFERENIDLVEGDISSTLPEFLQSDTGKIGFALIDANHRYGPTVQYFQWLMKRFDEESIMVVDDIHHSVEMEKAWKELRNHDLVYGSIDLFRCGILFFQPALNRQHFVWSL